MMIKVALKLPILNSSSAHIKANKNITPGANNQKRKKKIHHFNED